MTTHILDLAELSANDVGLVGGKAANLGALMRVDDVRVPPGFVVTSDAVSLDEIAARIDAHISYAVRSSATLEDLPTASFAGQYETFLNVRGAAAILEHVRRCFASLTNERATAYLAERGLRGARMAVLVQQMVPATISGVLFTADPLTGNRKHARVEAVFGLGEAFVSGHASPTAVLSAAQHEELVAIGRRIEAHFGRPQDIEWCFEVVENRDRFSVVQSRAITTLFPIPVATDDANRVYLSVGHQQMMTDAMRPLGLSFHLAITPAPMVTAAGRLFVDITRRLASPAQREQVLDMMGRSDPLMRDALETVLARDFVPAPSADEPPPPRWLRAPIDADPALVQTLIADAEASLAKTKAALANANLTGVALIDFIIDDVQELKRVLTDPRSPQAFMSGIEAAWWLNENVEKNAADAIAQSVPNNVTSEMGLALLDVADAMRTTPDDAAHPALRAWLEKYGMRCVGEIDITRPRWSERPESLLPLIRQNIERFPPGEAKRRFQAGLAAASRKEQELLARHPAKATAIKNAIDRIRAFAGYREYPKYAFICRYWLYKQALMAEAAGLVSAGVIREPEDVFWLSIHELRDAVAAQRVDAALIANRKADFAHFQKLSPPRVLTSEGECLNGHYRRDVPAGAIIGLGVSAGLAEGRARVIFDVADAKLEPGDILITPSTDPSWTPVFPSIKGLVTEVGGLMTHGAVIAREYGLPAIVGVENATKRIRDGARIRIDGGDGSIELLD